MQHLCPSQPSPLCRKPLWLVVLSVAASCQPSSSFAGAPAMFSTDVERCIVPAAKLHNVNHFVLRAILRVESKLNPSAINRNENGSLDVGIGQMNSIHFRELEKYGITPAHLKDACIGTYVAAWHLHKQIVRHGNTWFGIAAYHSSTPYFNSRYQILVKNELVRMGVLQEPIRRVPSVRPASTVAQSSRGRDRRLADQTTVASEPSLVFDQRQ